MSVMRGIVIGAAPSILLWGVIGCSVVHAQGTVYTPPASAADVQAAVTAASQAQAAATAAQQQAQAAAAAIPPVCSATPAKDTLNGSIGATVCTPHIDDTRPTAVQAGNTVLAANCTFSLTFARAFTSPIPFIYAAVVDSSGSQMPCKIQTRSSTGATGVCNAAQNTVLSLSIVTSGIMLLPFSTTCTAGTPVMFVGREPTQ